MKLSNQLITDELQHQIYMLIKDVNNEKIESQANEIIKRISIMKEEINRLSSQRKKLEELGQAGKQGGSKNKA